MHHALWYVVPVCHQYDVCKYSVGSVYVGLSESGLCVFREWCPVSFLVVGESLAVLLQSCCMLIVVIMGKWSDDSVCCVVHNVRLYSMLDTVVITGDDVCCSVVFGTLVGVFVLCGPSC